MTLADRLALDWSLDFLARSLAGLVELLGVLPVLMARQAWRRANGQLREMEAAARRLLVCLAGELREPLARTPTPSRPAQAGLGAPAAQRHPGRSGFCLFDPLESVFDPSAAQPACAGENACYAAGAVLSAGLQARLSALGRVLADPIPAARRLARWMSQRRAGRTRPIRLGRLPGRASRRALADVSASMLCDLHARALAVLNRPPP